MSHHSDDQLLQAGSDSFWEPGNYKRTTKRIEDGNKLCSDLQSLIQERAEIEKAYAKSLRSWSKRWGEIIEKGPEYGTIEAAWKGVLTEADRLSEVHLNMKDDLCGDVSNMIKTWQKDNYHKTMIHIKERKEMEDLFKKAQKPWAKHLAKVEKTKTEYHNACKMEKSATNLERNATGDSSLSPDQNDAHVKKLQDRVQKTKDEVQRLREKYEQALTEINKYNPVYIEDMSSVFIKCQEMEETRLRFFKSVLFAIHKSLNVSQNPSLPQIYEEFYHTVNNADHQKDLKWWSNNHGVNMAMGWPAFVEYTEEFRDITKGAKSKESLPVAPITLIHQRPVGDDLHDYPPPPSSKNNRTSISVRSSTAMSTSSMNRNSSTISNGSPKSESTPPVSKAITTTAAATTVATNNATGATAAAPAVSSPTRNGGAVITNGNGKAPENPFDEDEDWDEGDGEGSALVDNGEPGVPVKALYDYDGAESDELTFKQGEVFDKLEDEDEQGWCKGRKNGRVGLYPANYVEVVAS